MLLPYNVYTSRRGGEGVFCMQKCAKLAKETPHFDCRNGIYSLFSKLWNTSKEKGQYFVTHFFLFQNSPSASPSRGGREKTSRILPLPLSSSPSSPLLNREMLSSVLFAELHFSMIIYPVGDV